MIYESTSAFSFTSGDAISTSPIEFILELTNIIFCKPRLLFNKSKIASYTYLDRSRKDINRLFGVPTYLLYSDFN